MPKSKTQPQRGKVNPIKNFPGVYWRQLKAILPDGKPDLAYVIKWEGHDKPQWKTVGKRSLGMTPEKAAEERIKQIKLVKSGAIKEEKNENLTVGQIWKRYLETKDQTLKKIKDEKSLYKLNLEKRFGEKLVGQITPFELDKAKTFFEKKGFAPATKRHIFGLLRYIVNYGIKNKWTGQAVLNPVAEFMSNEKISKVDNRVIRVLSKEEEKKLLETLKPMSEQTHDMVLLSLNTGLRLKEVFRLRIENVFFEDNKLHVTKTKNHEARNIPMNQTVRNLMQKHCEGREGHENIFTTNEGKELKFLSNSFDKAVKSAGLNEGRNDIRHKVTFRTCRHTFATRLAAKYPLHIVKEILGHKSIVLTTRYSHPNEQDIIDAINSLE